MSQFCIKSHMLMLTQPSDTMRFCMWTTKWEWWKLVFITKHFHIFVRYIIIILNMIFPFWPLLFTCQFFAFYLINQSMFTLRSRQVFLSTGQTNVGFTVSNLYNHLCHNFLHLEVSQLKLIRRKNLFQWCWGHLLRIYHLLLHLYHGQ